MLSKETTLNTMTPVFRTSVLCWSIIRIIAKHYVCLPWSLLHTAVCSENFIEICPQFAILLLLTQWLQLRFDRRATFLQLPFGSGAAVRLQL